MRRYGHDRAGAVFHQDEVAYPDGQLLLIERIGGVAAGEKTDFFRGGQIFGLYRSLAHLGEFGLSVFFLRRSGY